MELTQIPQATQAVQLPGALALLSASLTLGLRHGIDWDHLAAIGDITTSARRDAAGGRAAHPVWLASLYALGHAAVVVLLGLAALSFRAVLPDWVDVVMERVVGLTLVALGFCVLYSLAAYARRGGEVALQSRWMLLFSLTRRTWRLLTHRIHGHTHDGHRHAHRIDSYGPAAAFGIGVIHGIGAETGTQVLLIAALGGAASQDLGTAMLFAFVTGLVLSNTAIAILASAGFFSASRAHALYVVAGVSMAAMSLYVGSHTLLGIAGDLPDLQALLSSTLSAVGPGFSTGFST